jgi:hypothetical protein
VCHTLTKSAYTPGTCWSGIETRICGWLITQGCSTSDDDLAGQAVSVGLGEEFCVTLLDQAARDVWVEHDALLGGVRFDAPSVLRQRAAGTMAVMSDTGVLAESGISAREAEVLAALGEHLSRPA